MISGFPGRRDLREHHCEMVLGNGPGADSPRRVPGWLIFVAFRSQGGQSVVNDPGGKPPKPLPRGCRGRILNALSGFARVSIAEKSWGVIPARPGLLRED